MGTVNQRRRTTYEEIEVERDLKASDKMAFLRSRAPQSSLVCDVSSPGKDNWYSPTPSACLSSTNCFSPSLLSRSAPIHAALPQIAAPACVVCLSPCRLACTPHTQRSRPSLSAAYVEHAHRHRAAIYPLTHTRTPSLLIYSIHPSSSPSTLPSASCLACMFMAYCERCLSLSLLVSRVGKLNFVCWKARATLGKGESDVYIANKKVVCERYNCE